MTLVAHDAVRHIQHTLSSDEVPAIGALRILNDAGGYLVNMHHWRWLEGTERSLDLAKDTNYVWLPDNFRELIAIQTTDGLNAGIQMTTQQQLVALRSQAVASASVYHAVVVRAQRQTAAASQIEATGNPSNGHTIILNDGGNSAVTFTFSTTAGTVTETATSREVVLSTVGSRETMAVLTDAINAAPTLFFKAADNNTSALDNKINLTYSIPGVGGNLGGHANWFTESDSNFDNHPPDMTGGIAVGPPRPRLDIWPTPTSDATAGIRVYYRSGWSALDGDNDLVGVPDYIESLYLQIVRAFARGYERESEADVSGRLVAVVRGPLFLAARQRDMESQPTLGPMRNGAVESMGGGNPSSFWNFTSVGAPS